MKSLQATLLACIAFSATPASAATLVLAASKDNTLYEDPTGTTSNGKGPGMFAGKNAGDTVRRALLQFDLSSIPANAVIEEVRLTLYLTKSLSEFHPVSLHPVLIPWGEGTSDAGPNRDGRGSVASPGDATWLHASSSGTLWSVPGGDFVSTASATTPVSQEGAYMWQSAGLVADVQSWVSQTTMNNGWLIHGDESSSGSAKRFGTRENTTAAHRPTLHVEFTIIPEPHSASLVLLGAMFLGRRNRRAK